MRKQSLFNGHATYYLNIQYQCTLDMTYARVRLCQTTCQTLAVLGGGLGVPVQSHRGLPDSVTGQGFGPNLLWRLIVSAEGNIIQHKNYKKIFTSSQPPWMKNRLSRIATPTFRVYCLPTGWSTHCTKPTSSHQTIPWAASIALGIVQPG